MYDCFISYTKYDSTLATWVKQFLEQQQVSVFMAELSVSVGQNWSHKIQEALRRSTWVIFLASRAACESPYVQQEIGGAIFGGKILIPIIWDMSPSKLPGWTRQYQSLNIQGLNREEVANQIRYIADSIHASKQKGTLIVTGVIAGLLLLAMSENQV